MAGKIARAFFPNDFLAMERAVSTRIRPIDDRSKSPVTRTHSLRGKARFTVEKKARHNTQRRALTRYLRRACPTPRAEESD